MPTGSRAIAAHDGCGFPAEAMPVTGVLIGSLCLDLPPNKVSVVEDEWMVPVDVDLLSSPDGRCRRLKCPS